MSDPDDDPSYIPNRIGGTPEEVADAIGEAAGVVEDILDFYRIVAAPVEPTPNCKIGGTPEEIAARVLDVGPVDSDFERVTQDLNWEEVKGRIERREPH